MATAGERIAAVEHAVHDLTVDIHGDGSDAGFARSIRGRVHAIENALATADKLAYAAEQVRAAAHEQRAAGQRRLDTWLQVTLAFCGLITAASAVIGAVAVLAG